MKNESRGHAAAPSPAPIELDPYRAIVFPNRVREQRERNGFPKLLGFAAGLPEIPYIRLSKIERGEVVARPGELIAIAGAIGVAPRALLIDPDDPAFDLAEWARPLTNRAAVDDEAERFAIKLAAAVRAKRSGDPTLTIAALEERFGIAPVILSRIENAQKPLDRWNGATVAALIRLFAVRNVAALRDEVEARYRSGALDPHIAALGGASEREARMRARIRALAGALDQPAASPSPPPPAVAKPPSTLRWLDVRGVPLADGLIGDTAVGAQIEAPGLAGERAFALRVCRPSLGGALPGHATVIVDPDRYPAPGGIAVAREPGGYRLLIVTQERSGKVIGYSQSPDLEVALDTLPPAAVMAVVAAILV